MGRSRRDGALLARGDGCEVPPRRYVRGAGPPRDRLRRGPVRRREHGDQQRALPPAARRARRGMAARLPHRRVRAPTRSTATRRGSKTSSPCRCLPGAPPVSSAMLERGAAKLGWRSVEFSRVFRYESSGRAVKQTMARTLLPAAIEAGARGDRRTAACAELAAPRRPHRGRPVRAPTRRRNDRAAHDPRRPRVRVRGRDADARAAAAQRHPPQHRQRAEDAPDGQDRGALRASDRPRRRADAPRHRVRARASPSAVRPAGAVMSHSRSPTRRADYTAALADWERVAVYYAAIRSEGHGRVIGAARVSRRRW